MEIYTGVTGRAFKDRLYEHRIDANTALSTHIWSLKYKNSGYKVTWKLKYKGADHNPLTKKCRIYLREKYSIMYDRGKGTFLCVPEECSIPLLYETSL